MVPPKTGVCASSECRTWPAIVGNQTNDQPGDQEASLDAEDVESIEGKFEFDKPPESVIMGGLFWGISFCCGAVNISRLTGIGFPTCCNWETSASMIPMKMNVLPALPESWESSSEGPRITSMAEMKFGSSTPRGIPHCVPCWQLGGL